MSVGSSMWHQAFASKSIQDATNTLVNTEDFASSMFKSTSITAGQWRAGRGSRACLDEPADIWRADPKHKQPAIQLLKETARGTETIRTACTVTIRVCWR